eukprot:TRINITY_DN3756_c0_g1_i1.p1 TRINITY_DN3756_c0_g1~~TRINITY_DN3756_c0_g1_i1.p1  ORF type:complete len:294 (-),score=71.35 TRINITY_DN3756_c0_g1_i1:14-895(-)
MFQLSRSLNCVEKGRTQLQSPQWYTKASLGTPGYGTNGRRNFHVHGRVNGQYLMSHQTQTQWLIFNQKETPKRATITNTTFVRTRFWNEGKSKKTIGLEDRVNQNIKETLRLPDTTAVLLIHDSEKEEISLADALQLASKNDKDLFLVDADSKPPVCKVIEKNSWRETAKVKQLPGGFKEKLKDFRISDVISEHDMQRKVELVKGLLEKRYRVKVSFGFKNASDANEAYATAVLKNVIKRLGPIVGPVQWSPINKKKEFSITITPNLNEVKKLEADPTRQDKKNKEEKDDEDE